MNTKTTKLELHSLEPPNISATAYSQRGALAGRKDLLVAVLAVFGLIVGFSVPALGVHSDRSENPTILLALILIVGLLLSFIVSPLVVSFIRRVRRSVGKQRRSDVKTAEGSLRGQRTLLIGETALSAGELEKITLLGWQEETGEDRVWDLTVICKNGATVDIISAFREADAPRKLGEAIAATMNIPFVESSVVGGQVTQDDPKNIVRRLEPW